LQGAALWKSTPSRFGQGLKLTNCAGIRANKGFRQVQKSNEFIRSSAKACPPAKNSQRLPAILQLYIINFSWLNPSLKKTKIINPNPRKAGKSVSPSTPLVTTLTRP